MRPGVHLGAEHDEADQQNHGSNTQVERSGPGDAAAVAAAIAANHDEGRDEGKLMEAVEGDDAVGHECARGTCGDKQGGDSPAALSGGIGGLQTGDGGKGDQDAQEHHDAAEGQSQRELKRGFSHGGEAAAAALRCQHGVGAQNEGDSCADECGETPRSLEQTNAGCCNHRN